MKLVKMPRGCLLALVAVALGAPGGLAAAEPTPDPEPPVQPDRSTLEARRVIAQEAQRVEVAEPPVLDPAIFTEISPYAAAQDAVRLPDDQRLE